MRKRGRGQSGKCGVEALTQAEGTGGVDLFDPCDAAGQAGNEGGVGAAGIDGVGEVVDGGFDQVIGGAGDVGGLVDDQAGDDLALMGAGLARFAGIEGEAFLRGDPGQGVVEDGGDAGVAGKGEVIGIAGVGGTEGSGEAGQATVKSEGAEIG